MGIGSDAAAAEAKKSKISKSAPRLDSKGEERDISTGKAPQSALPSLGNTESTAAEGDAIKLKVKGEAEDEIPVAVVPPPVDLPFKDVVGFARPGQTDRVLTGFVEHLPANEILNLAVLNSRQGLATGSVRLPRAPFVQMEVPPGLEILGYRFTVRDQNAQIVFTQESRQSARDLMIWDGFVEGRCVIKVGLAYTSELFVDLATGRSQRFFGDPVQFDVIRFDQDGDTFVEFRNDRLFLTASEELARDGLPLMKSLLGLLRTRTAKPYKIVIAFPRDGESLAARRMKVLQKFMVDALVVENSAFEFDIAETTDRGDVTTFRMSGPPEARP
jgi:hypothetical protein